ncbi:methylmalonyl-CoA decarboxylase alpha subunit [Streptococcus pneumoniae]|nr:methylmalonyl-CoA decarboxylase alpha subunit [Streptococcus pneumoniae]
MLDQKQQSNSFEERVETIKQGGAPKYHEQNKAKGKLFVRDRLALLFDNGEYVEDALFANCEQTGLPADGVVTHGDHAQLKRFYVFKKQLKNYVFRYFI